MPTKPDRRPTNNQRWRNGSKKANRKSPWSHLYDRRWSEYSKARLAQHPLCVRSLAKGKIVPAEVTDHIVPHRGDLTLFWDKNNHQSLSKEEHDLKTATEDGGFGRSPSPLDATNRGSNDA